MIMCYDYYWPGAPNDGPVAPLHGGSYNVATTIDYYLGKNVKPDKILLGVPWYGVIWQVAGEAKNAKTLKEGLSYTYNSMKKYAADYGRIFDEQYKCPWFRYVENDTFYQGWYDDSLSLALKYSLANEKGLLGIGIWAINYANGSSEIWEGIKQAFGQPVSVRAELPLKQGRIIVTDGIFTYYPEAQGDYTVEIFDLMGNTILSRSHSGVYTEYINSYPGSIYFCRITRGNETRLYRFVVF